MRVLMLPKACVVGAYQRKLKNGAPARRRSRVRPLARRSGNWCWSALTSKATICACRSASTAFSHPLLPTLRARGARLPADIVHIDEEPYNLATWHALWHARRSGARTLFFSWQNILRRYPPPIAWFERWVLRTVDHAITGTQSAADVWRAKGYRGPLTVIPQFGVDPVLFAPPAAPRENERFTVGFVGRLREEKGGADLLHALAQLPRDRWRLAIVGDGPGGALLALAEQLGIGSNISIETRPSTQMPAFYQSIDALAIPGRGPTGRNSSGG